MIAAPAPSIRISLTATLPLLRSIVTLSIAWLTGFTDAIVLSQPCTVSYDIRAVLVKKSGMLIMVAFIAAHDAERIV